MRLAAASQYISLLFAMMAPQESLQQVVTGLTLMNADTDVALGQLNDGDLIDLKSVTSALNIRADVSGADGAVGSVVLDLDSNEQPRVENTAPYALGGDQNGDYKSTYDLRVPGEKSLTVTLYSGSGGQGSVIGSPYTISFTVASDVSPYLASVDGTIQGELMEWHKITLGFTGPMTSEDDSQNPFTNYQLNVTFSHSVSGDTFTVPGYYAADGDAANTGATSGDVWLAHFTPNHDGSWDWVASFVTGQNVAVGEVVGTPAGFMDGKTGTFQVAPSNKTGRDLRGKGMLQYVGEHHLQFAGTQEYFLKAGADSPENFLAYEDFDGTDKNFRDRIKSWSPHQQDCQQDNPTWANGKGSEIMGAINYLSDMGMNVFSFLTMNIRGDDRNVYPYTPDLSSDALNLPVDRTKFDVSKLAQWEIVFEHADHMGMYMHFKTQETENDQLLDDGELGLERKVYYRELIARFGHHLALNWNLGEENTNTDTQRKEFADFFKAIDPYEHPVVMHTKGIGKEEGYAGLLGYPTFDGASLQTPPESVYNDTIEWRSRSAAAGHKWIVTNDEQNLAAVGVLPDDVDPDHDEIRRNVLWGNLLAGGGGVEYYFGYDYDNSDMTCQDFRSRERMWQISRYALDFFTNHSLPFWEMETANDIVSATSESWCLAQHGTMQYVIYLKSGGTATIDLPDGNLYFVDWFDPRNGGALQQGSVTELTGGNGLALGTAPSDSDLDWILLIEYASTLPDTPVPTTTSPGSMPITNPTEPPTSNPTTAPTGSPTNSPTDSPTTAPTSSPTDSPTDSPTTAPTNSPMNSPTTAPMDSPTPSPVPAPSPDMRITDIWLLNATDNTRLRLLANGDTIHVSDHYQLNLEAVGETDGMAIQSVFFELYNDTSLVKLHNENRAPYTLGGDVRQEGGGPNDRDFLETPELEMIGSYTLTITPWSLRDAEGTPGIATTIDFTVAPSVTTRIRGL